MVLCLVFLDDGCDLLLAVFVTFNLVDLTDERAYQLPRLDVAAPHFVRFKEIFQVALAEVQVVVSLLFHLAVWDGFLARVYLFFGCVQNLFIGVVLNVLIYVDVLSLLAVVPLRKWLG